jgi:hypothetical protein
VNTCSTPHAQTGPDHTVRAPLRVLLSAGQDTADSPPEPSAGTSVGGASAGRCRRGRPGPRLAGCENLSRPRSASAHPAFTAAAHAAARARDATSNARDASSSATVALAKVRTTSTRAASNSSANRAAASTTSSAITHRNLSTRDTHPQPGAGTTTGYRAKQVMHFRATLCRVEGGAPVRGRCRWA